MYSFRPIFPNPSTSSSSAKVFWGSLDTFRRLSAASGSNPSSVARLSFCVTRSPATGANTIGCSATPSTHRFSTACAVAHPANANRSSASGDWASVVLNQCAPIDLLKVNSAPASSASCPGTGSAIAAAGAASVMAFPRSTNSSFRGPSPSPLSR